MINESTGAFPDTAHRPAQRWPGAVLQGQYPLVLDALRADGAAWCTAAPCLRPRPCIDPYDTNACRRITKPTRHLQRAQARSGNHCGRRAGHHGEGWPGATRRRRWRSALTIATARRREPRCATEATNVRPIVVPARSGLARTQRFPGKFLYVHPEELSQPECLFGFSQCSTRVGDLRFAQPFVPEHTGCKVL